MNGHFKKQCVGCQIIFAQCRCINQDKTIERGVCGTCRYKYICDQNVNPEVKHFLEDTYPDETQSKD